MRLDSGSVLTQTQPAGCSMPLSEVYENHGQCSTDLDKGYLRQPRFWNTSVTEGAYSSARADYQENCENTTWKQISGD